MSLGVPGVDFVAVVLSFAATLVTSPAGMSGAVVLLPLQTNVLGTPSGAIMPTNLLYNAIATPGALYRFWRQGQTGGWLTPLLVGATLPGVVIGSVVRVELGSGARAFDFAIAAVLVPLGIWLIRQAATAHVPVDSPALRHDQAVDPPSSGRAERPHATMFIAVVSIGVGTVAGIYGIGSGSLLAPILVGRGYAPGLVSPASLASTVVTSVGGAATLIVMTTFHGGIVGPSWGVGTALGVGGIAGGYVGARIAPRIPDNAVRWLLGLLLLGVGTRYVWLGS